MVIKRIPIPLSGIFFLAAAVVSGQNEVISGQVTDAQTDESIPGVNILLKDSDTGTVTNIDGEFELRVPDLAGTLVFSYVGYLTHEVAIEGRTEINVTLHSAAITGDELVVVGYGTQRREQLTGSVGSLAGGKLFEQPLIRTSAALMGRLPGVQVIQNSGQPGANHGTIRIRGTGTLGNSNPLILIDGVEGSLNAVASSDIESISVLKDASSAAIYGSRAANGVILVTTRRGREPGMQVSFSSNVGFQQPADLPGFVDAGTTMRLENLGAQNLGNAPIWSEEFLQAWEANHQTDPDNYPNTDWVSALFSEPGYQQRHNIGIAGAGENYSFRGSLQYDDEHGNIVNFRYQRYNIRINTDVKASDRVSFRFDGNAIRRDQRRASSGIFQQTFRISPIYLDKFSDGSYAPGRDGNNPVAQADVGRGETIENYIYRGRFQGLYEPIEGMELSVLYAPEFDAQWRKTMTRQWVSTHPETGEELSRTPSQNSLEEAFSRVFQHTANITLTYRQHIADHGFNILGGTEYVDYVRNLFRASRDNFPLQQFEQLDAGSAANQQNSGNANQWKLLSFFGRVDYDYRAKYMVSANIRYDGSSRFISENRWGLFPSFSAGWRLSQESFMSSLSFINELKIRGSWGVLGNQNIGNYPFAAVVNLGEDFVFGNSIAGGAAQRDLANANITWEETTTTNIGLDMALLNNRVDLSFDWFTRVTDDILLELPIPLIIGMNAPFQNAGKVKNTGWEVEAAYQDYAGMNFSYRIGFNISDVKNKVLDLKGAGPFISGNSIIKEGYPINSIFGFAAEGLFQNQNEIDNHASQTGHIAPGDIRYLDLNGDGAINADDRTIIGDPFPSLNFGIDIGLNYKNVDVQAFFQGIGRRDVLLRGDAVWAFYNAGRIKDWQVDAHWTPENPGNTYPRLTQATSHNNFQTSSFWVYDASYLRLRNLQIGYTVPSEWIRGATERIRIYFLGHNLFTWFDNTPPGIDPNTPNNTIGNYYPHTRLYSLGIDIHF